MRLKALLCLIAAVWWMGFAMYCPLKAEELCKINGTSVQRSDFEIYMKMHNVRKKSGEADMSLCFEHFLFDKLKLTDAHIQKWDTLPVFKQELKVMVGNRLMSALMERNDLDSLYRILSLRQKKRFSSQDSFRFDQVFIPLSQRDGKAQEQKALLRLDTVYRALLQGADFKSYSPSAPVWASEVELLQEFSTRLRALSVGQVSAPFSSPLGVHIVRLLAKNSVPDGEDSAKNIRAVWSAHPDAMLSESADSLTGYFSTLLSDSLLVGYWDRKNPSSCSVEVSSGQLDEYFRMHKKNYEWSLPHFKGGIIYCQSKKDASKLKKQLKKQPLERWASIIEQWNKENPEGKADLRTGLFRIGQDAAVDKLVFKCGSGAANSAYPYSFSLGKCLKHGPESYSDVADKVKRDYLFSLEGARIEDLKRRFNVEINQEVLNALISEKSL